MIKKSYPKKFIIIIYLLFILFYILGFEWFPVYIKKLIIKNDKFHN